MKNIFYFFLVPCLFLACEEEVGLLDDNAEAPRLVVNALCSTEDAEHYVYLYRTGTTKTTTVDKADVTLTVNGRVAETVTTDSSICCFTTPFSANDEVRIDVTAGDDKASATVQVPQPLTVLGCDTVHVRKRKDFDNSDTDPYIRFMIHVRLADGIAAPQFFRLRLDREACSYYAGNQWYDDEQGCWVGRISTYEIFDHIYSSPNRYEYDFDPALNENSNKNESEDGIDWFDGVENSYGLFRDGYFENGEYTLYIDVEDVMAYYQGEAGHKDVCTFRIYSIPKTEYQYLWAASALLNTYEAGVLLSNPPIVPSNIDGGTGLFSVASVATLRYVDEERKESWGLTKFIWE